MKRKSSKRALWHSRRHVLQRCSVKALKANRKKKEQLLQQMQLQNTALLTLLQGAVSKQKDTEEKYVTCGIYDC